MRTAIDNLTLEESQGQRRYPPISDESRRIWDIIKQSLPLWTRKDIAELGDPILCDPFVVHLPSLECDARTRPKDESVSGRQMFSYCVLFSTRLAFFLPRHGYKEYPNNKSPYVLVGLIDVHRDISNPRLHPIANGIRNSIERSISQSARSKLEFAATYSGLGSRSFETQLRFVSKKTNWSVDDRTKDWESMLRRLLNDSREMRNFGDRRSFLLSNVISHSISTKLTVGSTRGR